MAENQDTHFREELIHYLESESLQRLTITLLSGDKCVVSDPVELIIGEELAMILPPDGGRSLFPFRSICNVDIRSRE